MIASPVGLYPVSPTVRGKESLRTFRKWAMCRLRIMWIDGLVTTGMASCGCCYNLGSTVSHVAEYQVLQVQPLQVKRLYKFNDGLVGSGLSS